MEKKSKWMYILPVMFGFFIMGFCDIVGISSDYAQKAFGWSPAMTGFIPSMVFIWFLFLGIPVGVWMNKWGRKNTVLLSMGVTVIGMVLPLIAYTAVTCMIAYAFLGIGNAILQVSLNPLLTNVVTDKKLLTSSLTAGQVVKALSSLAGPEIVLLAVHYFGHGDTQLWYYCFPILGGITLLSALWMMVTPIPREKMDNHTAVASFGATFALLKDRTILLLFLGIFFVVGVDVATNYISSKLMVTRFQWVADQAKCAPQVYFLSRTVGAFLGVFLMTKISEIKYFRWNIAGCIGILVVLALAEHNAVLNLVCIGGIGFLCSCIFSIIYSMAMQARPEKANEISGLMITAIAGGGAVTPVIGLVTTENSMVGGVFVIMACVFYLTYCAFGIKVKTSL